MSLTHYVTNDNVQEYRFVLHELASTLENIYKFIDDVDNKKRIIACTII